jgi:hypothetical protein
MKSYKKWSLIEPRQYQICLGIEDGSHELLIFKPIEDDKYEDRKPSHCQCIPSQNFGLLIFYLFFPCFNKPFQAAVQKNNRPIKLNKGGKWPQDLKFADLSLCLQKLCINFVGVAQWEAHLRVLDFFF